MSYDLRNAPPSMLEVLQTVGQAYIENVVRGVGVYFVDLKVPEWGDSVVEVKIPHRLIEEKQNG